MDVTRTCTREAAEHFAALWREQGFAISWTESNQGDGAKRVTSKGWNEAKVTSGDPGALAGIIANRLTRKNPVLVARASHLILIDADSMDDVKRFKSFDPPITRSVYTRAGRHYVYRTPEDWDGRYAGIYFEAGGITPKKDCYIVTPPALHPSGVNYRWVNEEIPIAALPMDVYQQMVAAAGVEDEALAERLEADPDAKIPKGQRHKVLISTLGKLVSVGASYDVALAAALDLNARRFSAPKKEAEVRKVVDDAYRRYQPDASIVSEKPADILEHVVQLSTVGFKSIEYADRPILQWGAFHLLAGKGGSCKGTWLANFCSRITRGLLEGERGPRHVVVVSSEDDAQKDLNPRLEVAGADRDMCHQIKKPDFMLPDDAGWLSGVCDALESRHGGSVGSVVIDPVSNHLGKVDSNSEAEVRYALAWLNDFAADRDLIVIGIRHLGKDTTRGALAGILGSSAWTDLPRAVSVMARDDVDDMTFHMELVKGNRGPLSGAGRVFKLSLVDLIDPSTGEPLKEPITKVAWDPLAQSKSLDDLLGPKSKTSNAKVALLDVLTVSGVDAEEVKQQIADQLECSLKTVFNAFKALEREHRVSWSTDGFGEEKKTTWFLKPDFDAQPVADW